MSGEGTFLHWLAETIDIDHINVDLSKKIRFQSYTNSCEHTSSDTFIIYEDRWLNKPDIIKGKILCILNLNKRIFGRQCIVKKISKPVADLFLEENHIYGSTNSKVKYGLFYKNNLFAVTTFASQRQFKNGRSAELLRFCSKSGYTVVGGLSKMLSEYIKDYKPDYIMTYLDLDWGNGQSFLNLGFSISKFKHPMLFYIDKSTNQRIPENKFFDYDNLHNYYTIKNKGSYKLIKKIN
jgi:hypothetical protein